MDQYGYSRIECNAQFIRLESTLINSIQSITHTHKHSDMLYALRCVPQYTRITCWFMLAVIVPKHVHENYVRRLLDGACTLFVIREMYSYERQYVTTQIVHRLRSVDCPIAKTGPMWLEGRCWQHRRCSHVVTTTCPGANMTKHVQIVQCASALIADHAAASIALAASAFTPKNLKHTLEPHRYVDGSIIHHLHICTHLSADLWTDQLAAECNKMPTPYRSGPVALIDQCQWRAICSIRRAIRLFIHNVSVRIMLHSLRPWHANIPISTWVRYARTYVWMSSIHRSNKYPQNRLCRRNDLNTMCDVCEKNTDTAICDRILPIACSASYGVADVWAIENQ